VAGQEVPGPNIVMIFSDDQRADTLGCMGNPWAETPHTDRLAREGALFENAFVITSLCCPSRATILSGLYTHVHGVTANAMDLDYSTVAYMPELLRRRGYATAFIGKYHLGGLEPSGLPRPGFDHWAGIYGQGKHVFCRLNINGEEMKTAKGEYVTDVLTGMAVDWIERQEERPYFLFLWLKSPHGPLYHPGRHAHLYRDVDFPVPDSYWHPVDGLPLYVRQFTLEPGSGPSRPAGLKKLLRLYAQMIPSIDDAVGAVYRALEARGELNRTMIIFSSDNGHLYGEHRLISKGLAYDPSIRVPLIIRYPAAFASGSRFDSQVLNVDVAPTILEAAKIPIPRSMQGRSLLQLGAGEVLDWRRNWVYLDSFAGDQSPPLLAARDESWKYIRYRDGVIEEEYFNLRRDPDERHNLLHDPASQPEVEAARDRLRELMAEAGMPAEWWDEREPSVARPPALEDELN
jgi:N-acetylglucosamine-6-sulfatase